MRGIDIESGAEAEIIGIGGIAGHAFAAWAGVGRNENQPMLGAGAAELAFLRDIGVGAGQPRQIGDDRQLRALAMIGHEEAEECRLDFRTGLQRYRA